METIKYFFSGLLVFALYKMGLTPEDFNKIFRQRSSACHVCDLRSGKFCSRKKKLTINKNNFNGVIQGCGCFLPFKKATSSQCPMDKWIKF